MRILETVGFPARALQARVAKMTAIAARIMEYYWFSSRPPPHVDRTEIGNFQKDYYITTPKSDNRQLVLFIFHFDIDPFIYCTFAFVIGHMDLTNLRCIFNMRAAIRLQVKADNLHGSNLLNTLRQQIDFCSYQIRYLKCFPAVAGSAPLFHDPP